MIALLPSKMVFKMPPPPPLESAVELPLTVELMITTVPSSLMYPTPGAIGGVAAHR